MKQEICVIVLNDQNEILLQKRSATKKYHPNMWALLTGHVEQGETPIEAAKRELQEELGIDIDIEDIKVYANGTFNIRKDNAEALIYYIRCNKPAEDFVIQEEELSEVKWCSVEEIVNRINAGDPTLFYKQNRISMFEYAKTLKVENYTLSKSMKEEIKYRC